MSKESFKEKYYRVTEETLKDFFDAGYDYRSSLLPEVISEFGESKSDFKTTFAEWFKEIPNDRGKEKYYKWVKASEKDLPTYKHIIREIASKKILSNTEIEQITKDNIYTCYGGIFSLEYYEWLKELSPFEGDSMGALAYSILLDEYKELKKEVEKLSAIKELSAVSPSDIVENDNDEEALKNKIAFLEKELENAEYHIGQLQQQNKDAEREIDKYR